VAVHALSRLSLRRLSPQRWPQLTALHVALPLAALLWLPVFVQEYRGQFFDFSERPVPTRSYHGVRWSAPRVWTDDEDLPQLMDWIGQNTERGDVLAHPESHMLNFFTERPAATIPL